MTKKLVSVFLCLCLVSALLPTAGLAAGTDEGDAQSGVSWGSDYETADEFTISNADELRAFASMVNNGNSFARKTVTLTADIDLQNEEWTPIGKSGSPFSGTFDGGGKIISNLKISGSNSDVGLFGYTTSGEVKNFTLQNADVKGYLDVGAVSGTPYTSRYTDIAVIGDIRVEGFAYVGGAFGKNVYANITNVDVKANAGSYVKASSDGYRTYVGGLAGFMGEGSHVVRDCDIEIDVIGSTCDVGGILGILHYNNKLENCTYKGSIALTGATDASDWQEIGALVGVLHTGGSSTTIAGCSAAVVSATRNWAEGVTPPSGLEDSPTDITDTITPHGKGYSESGTGAVSIEAVINGEPVKLEKEAGEGGGITPVVVVAMAGGRMYGTVQAALDEAEPGDTVELLKDTDEAVSMPLKSLTLKAAEDLETAPVLTGGIQFAAGTIPEGTEITISGLTFQGAGIYGIAWGNPAQFYNMESLTIKDNTFRSITTEAGAAVDFPYGFHLNNADSAVRNLTVTGNTFIGAGGAVRDGGINVAVCAAAVITNNTFTNMGMNGITISGKDSAGHEAVSVDISGNIFDGWALTGDDGRAIRMSDFNCAVDLSDNSFSSDSLPEEIIKGTGLGENAAVDLNGCYWVDGGSPAEKLGSGAGKLLLQKTDGNTVASVADGVLTLTSYLDSNMELQPVTSDDYEARIGNTYYDTLSEALTYAKANGGVILLLKDVTVNPGDLHFANSLSSPVIIDGGKNKYRIIPAEDWSESTSVYKTNVIIMDTTADGELTFKNVTFSGINEPELSITIAQAKKAGSTQKLVFDSCVFRDNTLKHIVSAEGSVPTAALEFKNCEFSGNTSAKQGEPALIYSSSGYANQTVLTGNTFRNNDSPVIYVKSTTPAEALTISGNTFDFTGGSAAMMIGGTVTLEDNVYSGTAEIYIRANADVTCNETVSGNIMMENGAALSGAGRIDGDVTVYCTADTKETAFRLNGGATGTVTYMQTGVAADADECVVTLNYNGGVDAEGWSMAKKTVAKGSAFEKPADPVRSGYDFAGWSYEGGTYDFTAAVTADITLSAQWTEIYAITISDMSNGTVTADAMRAIQGTVVTLLVSPDTGYVLYNLSVTDADGNKVSLSRSGYDRYTFVMPASDVTVKAAFGWAAPSSGGTQTDYAVVLAGADNGTVSSSHRDAGYGTTVTVTAVPDEGYVLEKLTVTDADGKTLPLIGKGDGKYAFSMPASKVTVEASFAKLVRDCPSKDFTDVDPAAWYHEAVDYALENGFMSGMGDGIFNPDGNLTRAMLCQILYSREGEPAVTGTSSFADVADDEWYTGAITWAEAHGIVSGYEDGTFGPNDPITREQLAAILWRYAGRPAAGETLNGFIDAGKVSEYAEAALSWAVRQGIVSGKGEGILDPGGNATRAEFASMLMRYLENAEKFVH